MKKIIHYDLDALGQLHCDACGYETKKVAFSEALVGAECPACLENMLTKADYDATVRILKFVDLLNKWLGPIFGKEPNEGKYQKVSVKSHNGTITINTKESE